MEEQLKDRLATTAAPSQQSHIDPLRRILIPIERRTSNGTLVFRTTDNEMYVRLENGSIRRVTPKVNGKVARKMRRTEHPPREPQTLR